MCALKPPVRSDLGTHCRSRTEALNVPSIVGLDSFYEIAIASFVEEGVRLKSLRSLLLNRIANKLDEMGF